MGTASRWHTLVAALWAALGCGFAYTFPTFSLALAAEYDLDPEDLTTIGIATTVVGFITWTSGLLTDFVGPRLAILGGGLLNVVGWSLYGAVAVLHLPIAAPTLFFTALGAVLTYGASFVTAAVFSVLVKTFPADQGRATAVGVGKAWVGIASGFSAMVFGGFVQSADGAHERLYYLFFLAAVIALFVLGPLPFPFLRDPGGPHAPDGGAGHGQLCLPAALRFRYLIGATVALIATTLLAASVEERASPSLRTAVSVLLLALAALPWLLLLPGRARPGAPGAEPPQGPLAESLRGTRGAAGAPPTRSPWECGPARMLLRPDAWLLMVAVFALQSGGLLLNANLGLITESRSGARMAVASANAMFSSSQSLGRLSGGALSDALVRRRVARPAYLAALCGCMAAGHGLLCLGGPVSLAAGVLLAGYAFGSQYPVLVITVAELFGSSRVASNYMIYDGVPGAVASLAVAKGISNWVYEQAAGGPGKDCHGDGCFLLAYEGIVVLQVAAAACSVLLACRALPVYRNSCWASPAAGLLEVSDQGSDLCASPPESSK